MVGALLSCWLLCGCCLRLSNPRLVPSCGSLQVDFVSVFSGFCWPVLLAGPSVFFLCVFSCLSILVLLCVWPGWTVVCLSLCLVLSSSSPAGGLFPHLFPLSGTFTSSRYETPYVRWFTVGASACVSASGPVGLGLVFYFRFFRFGGFVVGVILSCLCRVAACFCRWSSSVCLLASILCRVKLYLHGLFIRFGQVCTSSVPRYSVL